MKNGGPGGEKELTWKDPWIKAEHVLLKLLDGGGEDGRGAATTHPFSHETTYIHTGIHKFAVLKNMKEDDIINYLNLLSTYFLHCKGKRTKEYCWN